MPEIQPKEMRLQKKNELVYLGHLIDGGGIKPDPERVEALQKC